MKERPGPTEARPRGAIQQLTRWFGNFHPVVIHFPIAFLIGAILAELLGVYTGEKWYFAAGRFCIAVGALGAVGATLLGWVFADLPPGDDLFLFIHRWTGTVVTLLAVWAFVVSEKSHREGTYRLVNLRRLLFLLCAIGVAVTGHFGAMLVWGVDHFKW